MSFIPTLKSMNPHGLLQRTGQTRAVTRKRWIHPLSKLRIMKLSFVVLAGAVMACLMTDETQALTTGVLKQEITDTEDLISGGYLRVGLFALCGIAAGMSIMKQSIMGLVIAGMGAFFVYLMKGWINTNFAAVI